MKCEDCGKGVANKWYAVVIRVWEEGHNKDKSLYAKVTQVPERRRIICSRCFRTKFKAKEAA